MSRDLPDVLPGAIPALEFAAMGGASLPDALPRFVDKPWGHELWWAVTDRYAGKILVVRAGHRLSLQYHERKDESCLLLSGELLLHTGRTVDDISVQELQPGATWRNEPGRIHTIEAISDAHVLEVSTPELDDVVRIEDLYGR